MECLAGLEEASRRAAGLFLSLFAQSVKKHGRFSAALSGGKTPQRLYEILSSEEYRPRVDWPRVQLFWSDERCVPPEDPMSNYRMARMALIDKVPLPDGNVHRIRGELAPEDAARLYEDELRRVLAPGGGMPVLDLVLLGMGEDGHTASLFPGARALGEKKRLAVPVTDRRPPRVTLTLPAINSAGKVVFLVSGASKAEAVRSIVEEGNPRGYPAGLVRPDRAVWLIGGG